MDRTELKPASVFHYFDEICQVPRPSKKEEKIIEYLKAFGKKHNLETKFDEVGNVLIKKPATKGKEHLQTVVLQSHVDMVCEKNSDVQHDFLKDPIQTYIDGEWLRAKGTTLGADNGIGVATELAILAADDIEHGPIECLFTIDEETGLTGAFALKEGFMNGDILLNLDSEDEGELFIGCAGGIDTVAEFEYKKVAAPQDYFFFRVDVKGLTGGHSGDDINKMRANANKVLVRYLTRISKKMDMYLCEINGGNLRNAIPREAYAVCAVPMPEKENVRIELNIFAAEVEDEYAVTEPNMKLLLESETPRKEAIDRDTTTRLLKALTAVHHGIYAMSQDIEGLVETSSNLASIKMVEGNTIRIATSQRSSILSSRDDMANTVGAVFELAGATITVGEGYPGWKPNPSSAILKVAVEAYKRLFGVEPKVKAIHAGLECGLFLEKYPSLDMVSFGPTLRGVHSPDERMLIPTVDKFWRHLLEVLANIPEKK
ncbi:MULTISPECIES: aminoacyl-histidine dipeptidase [unclassified Bacteroides]|jgi:dipeptidase D|uniref:aminoacyl-histidine dipeptidase n=1 Tax=unclassified Bacteroides TaxID=2646097 RepID=UPI000E7E1993|nr:MULTISPECIES: aminoacyl-histidine dipeptidase [unclassified Bacteroides]RGN49176.1 aminoacyl-histidine dipeptidase [Bacteroides sp. OM05-12]RHR83286.1 aminoacyl-histidine dipeptidase [Bacteroides sp. AF16-49]